MSGITNTRLHLEAGNPAGTVPTTGEVPSRSSELEPTTGVGRQEGTDDTSWLVVAPDFWAR